MLLPWSWSEMRINYELYVWNDDDLSLTDEIYVWRGKQSRVQKQIQLMHHGLIVSYWHNATSHEATAIFWNNALSSMSWDDRDVSTLYMQWKVSRQLIFHEVLYNNNRQRNVTWWATKMSQTKRIFSEKLLHYRKLRLNFKNVLCNLKSDVFKDIEVTQILYVSVTSASL